MLGGPARLRIAGREIPSFRVCGLIGFGAAVGVALGVSAGRSLSLATELALIVTAVAVFFSLALVSKAVTGRERLVYYHHEIAVLGVVAAVTAAASTSPGMPRSASVSRSCAATQGVATGAASPRRNGPRSPFSRSPT